MHSHRYDRSGLLEKIKYSGMLAKPSGIRHQTIKASRSRKGVYFLFRNPEFETPLESHVSSDTPAKAMQ